ncbi:MAG: aldo/keto reductase [Gemmatimonadota bacterium]|nr:aldo/keto reductase [Gemmatimonadota bacterium]MXW03852.1 aldo/keto reductase [Gemmatimonadota bacterium]MYB61457.1 aldo/keto reductase [Gemmatimonadota bacterium]
MEFGNIANVDKPVSRLVQGTIMLSFAEEEYSFDLLDQVYDAGINTFDSAHLYGGGECERVLGRWIEDRGLRREIVILTKCCHMNADRARVTPYDISSDLHDSLARLNTDYVDLYLLHRDDVRVPVAPIMDTLNQYISAGNLGVIGGSNWTHDRIERANLYAATSGQQPFTVSSPNFSLAEQAEPPWRGCISISGKDGADARSWYQENQMPLFTWSSIASGFFSGRVSRDNYETLAEQGLFDESSVRAYCTDDNFDRLDRVEELANEKGLSIPQVALAYVLSQPLNIFALVGARNGDEIRANLQALDTKLTAEEMAWLNLERPERS